ncbi:hypothetical protein [Endozoicomonas sp. SCSIO W0465]|uniref:hypothetical protein n=1 Tax=Endozoicomonas sp. SCSIO W0465 TaxID=2918516 RepID=UPI0020753254|nr:hypothetical protein [Endozoicomonas sp. SCSIO W0465]USE35544.1 hypothetical protein MJO57_26215 [Endozoicomonas sp. SCSIO W0465]
MAFGLEVQQVAPNNHLNIVSPYGISFHDPFSDYRFPKVLVRVVYHQEPEQSEPLDLSDKTKAQQQSDGNILYTSQSGLRIDRVWSMAVKADAQSHSINANHPPLDSTLKDTAGNGFSGMGQSIPQISSVVDNSLHQPVPIPDQDYIDTFSKPEAPIAMITPPLNSEQLQQNAYSKNEFDVNASASVSVSGESPTISPDKASQKVYLESDKEKAHTQYEKQKAYRKRYRESEKAKAYQKAYQKAYRASEKGKAYHKAYQKTYQKTYKKSEKWKATRKAYFESDKGKAYMKAYEQSEKRKAYHKRYRESEKAKAYQKSYQKAYRESEKGKAYLKAYQKAYRKAFYKVFKNTGDREQAKMAGKQATAFIRELHKAKNSEFESMSIHPLPLLGSSS